MGGDRALPLPHTQGCLFPPGDRETRMLSCSQTTNASWPSFLQASGRKTSVLASHLVESRTKSPAEGWMASISSQCSCAGLCAKETHGPIMGGSLRIYWWRPGQEARTRSCTLCGECSRPLPRTITPKHSGLSLGSGLPAHTCFLLACFKLLVAVHPF